MHEQQKKNSNILVTSIVVRTAVAGGFHGDLTGSALPAFKTTACPADVKQSTSAVCATAIRTTVCRNIYGFSFYRLFPLRLRVAKICSAMYCDKLRRQCHS